jgi:hypothetical protein
MNKTLVIKISGIIFPVNRRPPSVPKESPVRPAIRPKAARGSRDVFFEAVSAKTTTRYTAKKPKNTYPTIQSTTLNPGLLYSAKEKNANERDATQQIAPYLRLISL